MPRTISKFGTITRISILVIIGISLTIGSFSILAYFGSQITLAGNSINIAGKNRFLTSNLVLISERYMQGRSTRDELNQATSSLDHNISILKNGGLESGFLLRPLPQEYSLYWVDVNQKWQNLQNAIALINSSSSSAVTPSGNPQTPDLALEIEKAGSDLVSASDILVSQLSQGSTTFLDRLVQLQISLLIVNVVIHTFILYLIVRMVKPIVSLTHAVNEVKKGKFVTVHQNRTADTKDEVSLLVSAFNEMVRGLENYDRAGKEFFNMAAHELRNPIQPILGMAEVLQKRNSESASSFKPEDQKQLLEVVVRNAHRLETLTEEILDVARIEGGTLNIRKEKLDLASLCGNIVADYHRVSINAGKGISMLFQNKSNLSGPLYVSADPVRITQVLYNLLNNALKFTESGTVTVQIERTSNFEKDKHEIKVQVVDSGKGIDPDVLAHMFEKFVSASPTGSGLGLFISKRIVENHGGAMWGENNKNGKGATFSFTIPVHEG